MSERYNYLEQVTADAKKAIIDRMGEWEFSDRDELEQVANEELWFDDSVTGNASDSYFCNAWKAEEAVCHNWDLLAKAINTMDYNKDILSVGVEACDTIIRSYLLVVAVDMAIDELEEEGAISYSADGDAEEEE